MALAACCLASAVRAEELVLCLDEHPHPPYVLADGQGAVPDAVRAAAAPLGLTVRFQHAPLERCWRQMEQGLVHGYPAVAASQELRQRFVFPLQQGEPDPRRATLRLPILLYRRKGSAVQWDGHRLHGLTGRVLVPTAAPLPAERLRQLGAQVDTNAKTLAQNFEKLLAGRGDLAVGLGYDGALLLRQSRFGNSIEALPMPLMQPDYYLAIAPAYYASHAQQVHALWQALGRHREHTSNAQPPSGEG